MVNIKHEIDQLWAESRTLTATGLLMLAALLVFAGGIVLDPRTVTGAPVWLKPAKFAFSTGLFALTIAWLFRYLSVWRPMLRILAAIVSGVLFLEVALISFQAGRGVPSHFNATTQFDRSLFSVMGVAIFVLWLATIGVFAALLRQRFQNAAWGWWLRLGVLLSVIGSAAGGSMLRITPDQLAQKRAGKTLTAVGAHTVGAADGGPGLPGTGWSTEGGDLRVAHFLGLHGMQVLPCIGFFLLRRRSSQAVGVRLAFVSAASYAGLLAIVWWQALRGQSVIAPDETTLLALGSWLAATAAAALVVNGSRNLEGSRAAGNAI